MVLHTRHVTSVLLVLLVVLAGCLGAGGSDDSPTTAATDRPGSSSTSGSSTATVVPNAGSHPLVTQPLSESHAASLREAESFTLDYRMAMAFDGPNESRAFVMNWTAAVDLSTGEQYVTADMNTSDGFDDDVTMRTDLYVAEDGTMTQRSSFGGTVQYHRPDSETYNTSLLLSAMGTTSEFDPEYANFTYEGVTTLDGERMHLYTVADPMEMYSPAEGSVELNLDSMTVFDLRLYLDDAGTVRKLVYDVEVVDDTSTVRVTFEMTYTDVGTTTVTEPDWLADAERALEER